MITKAVRDANLVSEKPSRCEDVLMTESEIAERWGVSRTAVWMVKRKALAKLKKGIEREAAAAGVNVRTWLYGDDN